MCIVWELSVIWIWSALTFINYIVFQKIWLSVVLVFLLEEQPRILSKEVLKSKWKRKEGAWMVALGHHESALHRKCRSSCRRSNDLLLLLVIPWGSIMLRTCLSWEVCLGPQLWALFCFMSSASRTWFVIPLECNRLCCPFRLFESF